MSLLGLLAVRDVADFAEWFRAGAEYAERVATGMGFAGVKAGPLATHAETTAALRAGRTALPPAEARTVAATFLADAAFCGPFLAYTPRWYRLALAAPVRLAERRLRRVARPFVARATAEGGPEPTAPSFSRPGDLPNPEAVRRVADERGFAASFLLADAVLHAEWFAFVARAAGVRVPEALLERTVRESAASYAGERERLSPEVRRFQALLFADDAWVRDVDATYRLNSALFGVWERLLRRERRRLLGVARGDGG